MVQDDGRYPRDFDRPKRVEEFLNMDGKLFFFCISQVIKDSLVVVGHSIDRILSAYNLRDSLSLRRPGLGSRTYSDNSRLSRGDYEGGRDSRLFILLEFLGVDIGRGELRENRLSLGGLSLGGGLGMRNRLSDG